MIKNMIIQFENEKYILANMVVHGSPFYLSHENGNTWSFQWATLYSSRRSSFGTWIKNIMTQIENLHTHKYGHLRWLSDWTIFCMEMAALKKQVLLAHTPMHNFTVFAFSGHHLSHHWKHNLTINLSHNMSHNLSHNLSTIRVTIQVTNWVTILGTIWLTIWIHSIY